MIKITKGREPSEWTTIRNTPGISYEDAPKDALREALSKEQGGLCAYCMRRVHSASGTQTTTRIEHLKPRKQSLEEGNPHETLAYNNMVLCCDGDIEKNGIFHCDRSKKDSSLSFSLFDQAVFSTITYSSKNGTIKSSNPHYDKDFNEILNLNHPRLEKNRLAVIKGIVQEMGKKKWRKKDVTDKLLYYSNITANGNLPPYCGVIIWYLNKKLRQFI